MRNKQMNVWKRLLLVSVLMLFAVPLVSAAPAPAMYLYPEDGTGTCGESTTVDLKINTSSSSTSAYAWIYFDPACVNITAIDYTGSPWQPVMSPGWSHQGDHVILSAVNFAGVDLGDYQFAALTIECVDCDCTSDIKIIKPEPLGVTVYNGTFTCVAGAQPPCLGDCYNDTGALVSSNVSCYACLDSTNPNGTWENYEFDSPCAPGTTVPRRSYDHCPQCCDGIDNDDDTRTDWSADPECACCLDETEDVDEGCPGECVPELPTLALAGIGILGAILLARKRE